MIAARAAMPERNSSGNVASDAASTPSARRPLHVNAIVTQWALSGRDRAEAAVATSSSIEETHARPAAGSWKLRKSYRPASAGVRSRRKCWMSFSSNMALLHLVEDVRKVALDLERLLDLRCSDVRILPIFEEARVLVLADEGDERRHVRLPVRRKTLELL